MWTVKEVIDNSGMTIEEFANHYEIPVETLKAVSYTHLTLPTNSLV